MNSINGFMIYLGRVFGHNGEVTNARFDQFSDGGAMKLLNRIKSVRSNMIQSRILRKIQQTYSLWNMRHATRKELAVMDNHMLKDIGLSLGDRLVEAEKPFWRR